MTKTDLLLTKVDIEEAINSFNKKCIILGCPEECIDINASSAAETSDSSNKTAIEISIERFNRREASDRRFNDAASFVEAYVGNLAYLPEYKSFHTFSVKDGKLLVSKDSKGVYTFDFARS